MSWKLRTAASILSLATASAVAPLAFGQEVEAPERQPRDTDVIVITAQKREENLQDMTVSVSVLPTEQLQANNSGDISDLNNLVPSVNLNGTVNGRVPIGIRGVSSNSNEQNVGIASGVGIMIDGVTVPSDSMAANMIEDVERIEVLKGPQATLGGRTAAQGVINIVTRGPSSSFEASVNATYTDDEEKRLNFFVGGPVADTVRASLAAWYNDRQLPIENAFNGQLTTQESFGARGKLEIDITSDLQLSLMARTGGFDTTGGNFVYSYLTPGSTLLFPGSPFTQAFLLPGITPSNENQTYNSPVTDAGAIVRDEDFSATIDYALGNLDLRSITAYSKETLENKQDLFAVGDLFWQTLTGIPCNGTVPAPPSFCNTQSQNLEVKQFSQEVQLASPAEDVFSYLVGVYYSDTEVSQRLFRSLPPALVDIDVAPRTQTFDIFGRGTWRITPDTSLIAGLRANRDTLKVDYVQNGFAPEGAAHAVAEDTSSVVVGDFTVQQRFGDDVMAYATYARGYAPPAYNTAAALPTGTVPTDDVTATLGPVDRTDIDHLEIGTKGTYLDGSLILNAAVFDTVYSNYQIQTYSATPGFLAPPLVLDAAGEVETRGVEVDAVWHATDDLTFTLNTAYTDAQFNTYPNAPCYGGQSVAQGCALDAGTGQFVQNLAGKPLPNAPKFRAILSAEQFIALETMPFDLTLRGSYAYRDKAQMLPDQNPQAVQDAFGLLNLSATLSSHDEQMAVTFFVNNVTDEHYAVDFEDFWTGPWSGTNTVIVQPARDANRYFGARISLNY